jgi:hypothetical protein
MVVAVGFMAAVVVAVDSMAAADMAAVDIGNPSASVDVETAVSSYAGSRFVCESSMLAWSSDVAIQAVAQPIS